MTNKNPPQPAESGAVATGADRLPPLDFTTFVLSLSTTALVSLGLVPDSDGSRPPANLPLARQTIDLIDLLRDKTRGNLTGEEERLLDQVLTDLRLKFVQAVPTASKRS